MRRAAGHMRPSGAVLVSNVRGSASPLVATHGPVENLASVANVRIAPGIRCIDAPLSGGIAAAAAGTLAFMCGGSVEAEDSARPLRSAMGSNMVRAGDSSAGQVARICSDMLLAVHMRL